MGRMSTSTGTGRRKKRKTSRKVLSARISLRPARKLEKVPDGWRWIPRQGRNSVATICPYWQKMLRKDGASRMVVNLGFVITAQAWRG